MATFNETRAPTSRKYVAGQGIVMSDWSKTFQTFWSHSSVFALEKQPKNLNFQRFFTSRRPFGGYFQWNAAPTSRKYVAEQDIVKVWFSGSESTPLTQSSHKTFFLELKNPKNVAFLRHYSKSKNGGVQPKQFNSFKLICNVHTFSSYISSGNDRTHFTQSGHERLFSK